MTRKELITIVAEQVSAAQGRQVQKSTVGLVVDAIFEEITSSLNRGEQTRVKHFGTFLTKVKPARAARNPKTGAVVQLKERRVVNFRNHIRLSA